MAQFYAKQVDPEFQEDTLFYTSKNGELKFEDDVYSDNVVIYGNKEYKDYRTLEFQRLLDFENSYYELDSDWNGQYWECVSDFINCYLKRSNGKKYTTKEVHKWKELFKKYEERYHLEDIVCDALELMTGKKWRRFSIGGYCQSEWQYGYASEDIQDYDIRWIETCYFNTGVEYIVYESKEDFENEEDSFNIYCIDDKDLKDRLGSDIEIYHLTGYKRIPQYELVKQQTKAGILIPVFYCVLHKRGSV